MELMQGISVEVVYVVNPIWS